MNEFLKLHYLSHKSKILILIDPNLIKLLVSDQIRSTSFLTNKQIQSIIDSSNDHNDIKACSITCNYERHPLKTTS